MSKIFFGPPRQSGKYTNLWSYGVKGVKNGYLDTFGAKRQRKIFGQIWSEKLGFWIYGKEAWGGVFGPDP